jgi:hypothetical protein
MASTYSSLKIELIATGEQAGTWGVTTNTNLGTALEEAITGTADVSFSSADVTLTLTDTNGTQTARNLRLNLTGTSGGARNLIVPAIEKLYVINNGLADAVTVKNSTGTGIAVPTGKTMFVFNNGTNVLDVTTYLSSLTLGTSLPVASGGSGAATLTGVLKGNGTSAFTAATAGTDYVAPGGALGTPSSGTLTNTTGLPISTGVSGLGTNVATALAVNIGSAGAAVVNGGALGTPSSGTLTNATGLPIATGVSGLGTGVATFLATPSAANLASAVTEETGSGNLVFATSPTLVTPVLGTPTSGTLSGCTVDGTDSVGFRNVPINSQSAAYTAVLADSGKAILHPSTDANARTFTIPANASVAYPLGTAITFINMTSQVVTIAITSDTMYLAGTGTTGSRSLAQYGMATAIKMTSTTWLISGSGLT